MVSLSACPLQHQTLSCPFSSPVIYILSAAFPPLPLFLACVTFCSVPRQNKFPLPPSLPAQREMSPPFLSHLFCPSSFLLVLSSSVSFLPSFSFWQYFPRRIFPPFFSPPYPPPPPLLFWFLFFPLIHEVLRPVIIHCHEWLCVAAPALSGSVRCLQQLDAQRLAGTVPASLHTSMREIFLAILMLTDPFLLKLVPGKETCDLWIQSEKESKCVSSPFIWVLKTFLMWKNHVKM